MVSNVIELPKETASKKLFSKKKFIFVLIGFVVVFIGILFIQRTFFHQAEIRVGTISERSQEFLDQQIQKEDRVWNQVDLSESSPSAARIENVNQTTECFTLTIPFEVTRIQDSENDQGFLCRLEMQVVSPRSNLVITAKQFQSSTTEDPGVTLRKNNPEKFHPVELPVEHLKKYQAFTDEESLTIFFREKDIFITVAFSNIMQMDLLKLDTVAQLLDSMEVIEKTP